MKQTIIALLIFTLSVTSCTKRDPFPEGAVEPSAPASETSTPNTQAKISVSGSNVEYRINTVYENNYVHCCQLGVSNGGNACGPASYMLAAHMVAAGNGWSFMPSNTTKLTAIVNNIGAMPIDMGQISTYVSRYDGTYLKTTTRITTDRNNFKSFLENSLATGDPVIVPIRISGSSRANDSRYTTENSSNNYDLDGSDQYGRPNYINTSGIGHFVVVIGIKVIGSTGNGYVYYKDPLASGGATKVCVYGRFLNSALANGASSSYYDAITISKK